MKNLYRRHNRGGLRAEFERMRGSKLTTEVATRRSVAPWLAIYEALPNPDPVLRKTSNRIDILHEIRREPHVKACTRSRKSGVAQRLWKIERENASENAARTIELIFKNLRGSDNRGNVRTVIREMLDGWGYGYLPLEILWERQGNLIVPSAVVGKPPEWFSFGRDNELRLKKSNSIKTEEVEPYKFLLARSEASYNNPYGEAEFSLAFWPVTFKKGGIKHWAVFLETFGMPHAIGKVPRNAEKKERDDLQEALGLLIRDAAAVVPDDASVELLEAAAKGATSDLYEKHARYHDGEISKVILGHAAAADSTPGRLGNETGAMDVRADIINDDSSMVMECFDELIRYIHELNPSLGVVRPRFELYDEEDVDADRADRDFKLMNSNRIILKKKYFTRCYDIREDEIEVDESIQTPQPGNPSRPAAPSEPPPEFAAGQDGQDAIDDLADCIDIDELRSQALPLVQPILDLVEMASGYDEVEAGLLRLYPDMNSAQLEKKLQLAMLLAHTQGTQPAEATA